MRHEWDARVDWKETLTESSTPYSGSGHGDDLGILWGGYARGAVVYQLNDHWGVEADAQFQDIGTYSHNFAGRTAALDLSQSVFLQVGVSYSF